MDPRPDADAAIADGAGSAREGFGPADQITDVGPGSVPPIRDGEVSSADVPAPDEGGVRGQGIASAGESNGRGTSKRRVGPTTKRTANRPAAGNASTSGKGPTAAGERTTTPAPDDDSTSSDDRATDGGVMAPAPKRAVTKPPAKPPVTTTPRAVRPTARQSAATKRIAARGTETQPDVSAFAAEPSEQRTSGPPKPAVRAAALQARSTVAPPASQGESHGSGVLHAGGEPELADSRLPPTRLSGASDMVTPGGVVAETTATRLGAPDVAGFADQVSAEPVRSAATAARIQPGAVPPVPAEQPSNSSVRSTAGDLDPEPRTVPERKLGQTVLLLEGLQKSFDNTVAVAGIDLDIRTGSIFGLVGPNGAGKTTTLSMVTGLLRPDSGRILVHGADVWRDPVTAKRHMGVLPDRLRLFDRLTGAQLLYYSGMLRGLDRATVKTRCVDLAAAFGLEEALGRLVSDYSAGMTKKVALAAALIHSPRVLILDEPFEAVDPVSAANVIEILQRYAAAGGTVVLSSHSMELVQRICDSAAIIVHGRVLAAGSLEEVRRGRTLEQRFIELAGGRTAAEGMEWLHNFSD